MFARDFADLPALRALTRRLRELAAPRRLFVALDEEGGWVSQLAGHLVVPPNAALLARGAAPGDVAWLTGVTGRRLRALGFDWNYAPVADVHSEPDNPVIGPRAWGATPADAGAAIADVLAGLRAANVASCLKHFPGHGDTRTDSHLALPVCDADLARLEARELATFRAHLGAADSVMTAHVVYPALGAGCDLLLYANWSEGVRRARLELADALVDGRIAREPFDAARPRLAAFDAGRPAPTAAELGTPLESLTPPDWEERLAAIVARGLRVEGSLPAAAASGAWQVEEPEFKHGPTLAADLAAAGVPVGGAAPLAQVIAIAQRVPVAPAALATLRARCAARPTILVGLQNDAFLARVPEAAVRLSASDCTPLTRRVVARRLARLRQPA